MPNYGRRSGDRRKEQLPPEPIRVQGPSVQVRRTTRAELLDNMGEQKEPVVIEVREGQVFNPARVVWEPGIVRLEMHSSLTLTLKDADVLVYR